MSLRSKLVKICGGGVLAVLAVVSVHLWLQHAPLYFRGETDPITLKHRSHGRWLLVHIVAASPALFLGPFALWIGLRRRFLKAHRWAGRVYLGAGALGVGAGIVLSIIAQHRPTPNFNVGLVVLGTTWFGAAAMAWRAILNRRVDSHREWMIRSYILTWSFVVCRIPEYPVVAPLLNALGPGGDATVLWIGWVTPLLVAQLWLEWSRGAAAAGRTAVQAAGD